MQWLLNQRHCRRCLILQGKAKKKASYSDDEFDDDSDFETKVRLWSATVSRRAASSVCVLHMIYADSPPQ